MRKLQAQDFFFYPNGKYQLKGGFQDTATNSFYTDLEEVSTGIRIFGTKKEIDKALNEYIDETGLALDECYYYQVEKKGSYWYDIFKDPVGHNKEVKRKLKIYKDLYEKQNKTLILRIQ